MKTKIYSHVRLAKVVGGAVIILGAFSFLNVDDKPTIHTKVMSASMPGNEKITICHLPPGNPENRQTITIGIDALQAHLDHGDFVGDCDNENTNAHLRLPAGY